MGQIENKVAWSETTVKTMRECLRRYWYTKYGSWEGWLPTASKETRLAYLMKKMTNLPMFVGSVVHDVIQHGIAYRRASNCAAFLALDKAEEEAIQALRHGWLDSVNKRWEKNPARAVNLAEHYYDESVTPEKCEGYKQKVLRCLRAFYGSPLFARILALKPDDFLTLEEFQGFETKQRAAVSLKIDFGFRSRGKVVLIDWKTGKATEAVLDQLATYAMYCLKMGWAKRPEDIVICAAYLDAADPKRMLQSTPVAMRLLERQAEIIHREYPLLTQLDAVKDDPEKFPVTDCPGNCKRCHFRGMCPGADRKIGEGVTPF